MKETLKYENGLTVTQERKSKTKNPKIIYTRCNIR